MKITKIETIILKDIHRGIWVRVHTDAGYIGLGETWYTPRGIAGIIHELFAPILVGQNPLDIERHWKDMFQLANSMGSGGAEIRAISALDIALWDIAGQAMEQPIYRVMGGACRDRIRIYNTCSVRGKDGGQVFKEPEKLAESFLNEGITAIKVVLTDHLADEGHGYDFRAKDLAAAIAPLEKMRRAVGNDLDIAHDGHGKFSLTNAIAVARAMEDYDLLWQEELLQPVNVETHLRLKQATRTPICGAERLQTRYQFREYIEKGALDYVMPDLVWTGGISEVKRIATLAETYQLPLCPHDSVGPVNLFACAHVCMNVPNAALMETVRDVYQGWYRDIVEPPIPIEDGYLKAPEEPGLGARLKESVWQRDDLVVETSDADHLAPLQWPGFRSQQRPDS